MPENTTPAPTGIDVPGLYLMLGEIKATLADVREDAAVTRTDVAALRKEAAGTVTEQATLSQRVETLEEHSSAGMSRRWALALSGLSSVIGYSVAQLGSTFF